MTTNKENTHDASATATGGAVTVPVMVRLFRHELDELQRETGANADATAVACFVRKELAARKRA